MPPADSALPDLPRLFDAEWAWGHASRHLGFPTELPDDLHLRSFSYEAGHHAIVTYTADWRWEGGHDEDDFSIELLRDGTARLFRFPNDPALPGLAQAADAGSAHQLITRYVGAGPKRVAVQTVRYRPGRRAVLKHKLGWGGAVKANLYARVMQPSRIQRFVAAGMLARQSGFAVPRLAGRWPEGGVVWLSAVPGETVRYHIRNGKGPEPEQLVEALDGLWTADAPAGTGRPLDVRSDFAYSRNVLEQLVSDDAACATLSRVTTELAPFVKEWRPSAFAHNDFYDDQVIVMPDQRLAIVDFEEVGPGDPMVDVGNMLAHLEWDAHFGSTADYHLDYARRLRAAALERFGWEPHALDLRVAYSLFRIAPNPARQMHDDWKEAVGAALELTGRALDGGSAA